MSSLCVAPFTNSCTEALTFCAISVVFATAVSGGDTAEVLVQYAYDFEDPNLFSKTGSVLLNLVEFALILMNIFLLFLYC